MLYLFTRSGSLFPTICQCIISIIDHMASVLESGGNSHIYEDIVECGISCCSMWKMVTEIAEA